MTGQELLDLARYRLDDRETPYGWADTEIIVYMNDAINRASEKGRLFLDSSTAAICQITVLAADAAPDYTLDSRVFEIVTAKMSTQTLPLIRLTRAEMEQINPDWRNATKGTPLYFLTDYTEGKVTINPGSNANATIYMTVYRLPLAQFSATTLSTEISIPLWHHSKLLDGILADAYDKPDTETLDPEKAARHRLKWEKYLDEIERAQIRLHSTPLYVGPNYGAI